MHNINQGFIINDLFCASFSTHISRMFTNINQEHVYVTLTEQYNFIYLNIQSQNSQININFNGVNQTFQSKWIKNRWLHQSLLNIEENNTIYIYNDNQIQGPYYYYDFKNDSINIVSGGDLGNTKLSTMIWKQMTRLKNIDVINIGGDIAYDNGMVSCYLCWDAFFNQYQKLCDKQQKLIPLILALGNHDIGRVQNANLLYNNQKDDRLPYYFSYFPQHTTQQLTYFKHQLGNIQFITLDSSYVATIDEQVDFLEQSITSNQQLYISYHVPVVPLTIADDEFVQKLGKYLNKCTLVFEHHKHYRKRSKSISLVINNNGISYRQGGTIYLGNGAMGVVSNKMVKHHSIEILNNDSHFYLVSKQMVQAISWDGRIVDEVKLTPVL